MSNGIGFRSTTNHDEFLNLLENYDITLETYQLGQILTRAMFFIKNGNLGGWQSVGAKRCEKKFADNALKLNWKEKVELAKELTKSRKGSDLIPLNETRVKSSLPLLYYIYGNEQISIMRDISFKIAHKIYIAIQKNISEKEKVETQHGLKLYSKSELIRERNLNIEKLINIIEPKNKKKFKRGSPIIKYESSSQKLVYYPENHPYFREWLLYNYAFWSPIFKSRTLSMHKDPAGVKIIKSRELIQFLSKKFKLEHPIFLVSLSKNIRNYDLDSTITEKLMSEKFFSEKSISDLLYKNSFFKKERLASIYNSGIIDRDIITFAIETRHPFKELKSTTLSLKTMQLTDILIGHKKNKNYKKTV